MMHLHGRVSVTIISPYGEERATFERSNLVVKSGRDKCAAIFVTNDGSIVTPRYFKIGDGITAVADTDTDLAGTVLATALAGVAYAGHEVSYQATLANNSGLLWTISEAGIFSDEPV